ncbi:hypothetical protein BGZ76_001197, partial [Entomortierella beljakovae]
IITFDERGVSRHTNHIACYVGLTYFIQTFKERTPVKACYALKSVSLVRKYISLLDLPITVVKTEALMPLVSKAVGIGGATTSRSTSLRPIELLYVSSPRSIAQAKRGMEKHESQMVWFRKVYVLFSRYMAVNELRRVM